MAWAFAATAMPSYDRRFTGDWAKDNERRAAAQRAEQQRHADFYARQTQKKEERENKEAQERFAESQRKRWGGVKTDNRFPEPHGSDAIRPVDDCGSKALTFLNFARIERPVGLQLQSIGTSLASQAYVSFRPRHLVSTKRSSELLLVQAGLQYPGHSEAPW
jgi:hypothetical protein